MSEYNAAKKKEYYQKNKSRSLEAARVRYYKNQEYFKFYQRKRRLRTIYFPHLSIDEAYAAYEKLREEQKDLCAICGNPESKIDPQQGRPCTLAVDHCHKTGKVRGLLCFRCNTNLGWYETMSDKFLAYLERTSK
jgi:hypothetical protein